MRRRVLSLLSLSVVLAGSWIAGLPAQQPPPVAPEPLRRDAVAQHRALPRRPDQGRGRPCRASRTPSISAWSTAASGRRPTPAAPGSRSSTTSRPDRSAGSPSRRPIPTSSTSAAAKGCRGRTSRSATASTSPPTRARPGRTSACATRSRFPKIAVDPKNPNRLFVAALGHPVRPQRGARHLPLDRRRPARSSACCSRTRTPAARTSTSIPPTPTSSTRRCGSSGRGRGRTARGTAPTAGIFKSTDGGTTWKPLTQGLPDGIVNAELAIAPSNPRRLYATRRGGRRRHRHLSIGRRGRDVGAQRPPTRGRPAASTRSCRTSTRRMPTR